MTETNEMVAKTLNPEKPGQKMTGWFSWRHLTSEGLRAYREQNDKEELLKQGRREVNMDERQQRSPQQQLDLLDKRLGSGQGAVRERARLNLQIQAQAQAQVQAQAKPTAPAPPVEEPKEAKPRGKPTSARNKKQAK